ncbi:hypothetical protein ACETU7_36025 [Rhodococcus sp. 3Y1]
MKNNRYWPLAIAVVIALIMLFSPGSTVPSSPENTDKITHTLMFAVLAITSLHARIPVWLTAVVVDLCRDVRGSSSSAAHFAFRFDLGRQRRPARHRHRDRYRQPRDEATNFPPRRAEQVLIS